MILFRLTRNVGNSTLFRAPIIAFLNTLELCWTPVMLHGHDESLEFHAIPIFITPIVTGYV